MRILFIEDSSRLRKYVQKALSASGFAVDLAADGEEGLWLAESDQYDVILLDLMLPKRDGLSVLKRLREQGCQSQVLILSAKDAVDDRVSGLQMGADDYLVKPFALSELIARVQTLVRRRYQVKSPLLCIGGLEIDTVQRTVCLRGNPVYLPPREYALLELLAFRQGEVVSRAEIEERIYDERVEPMSNVVDAAVYSLRKKIDTPGEPSLIRTRRGMGYLLEARK